MQNFDHNLTAACSISGYAYPLEMLQEGAVQTVGKPLAAVFRPFAAGYHNLTFGQYAGLNAVDGINHAGIPEFILHGEMDTTVPYEGISILSKQKQITNPHVRYETITGPYADHNLFFSSDAANAYKEEFNAQGKALEAQYNGDIPQEVRDAAYASRNLPLINEVNTELLQTIEQFYLDAIAGTDDTAATMRMME